MKFSSNYLCVSLTLIAWGVSRAFPTTAKTNLSALSDEANLIKFLSTDYEPKALKLYYNHVRTEWEYSLDLDNKAKEQAKTNATLEAAKFEKEYWMKYFRYLDPANYRNVDVQRQVVLLKELGSAALEDEKLFELERIKTDMVRIYSTAKICPFHKMDCDVAVDGLSLDPDIEAIMATSTNYDELLFTWGAWRDVTGRKMKDQYETYVELLNEASRANNFSDKGAMWRNKFESATFEHDLDRLWQEVGPLYDELHRYVLTKLKLQYRDRLDVQDGLIPAHVLGNMWAQSWINIGHLAKPFPNASRVDVTAALRRHGYTPLKMFQTADEFYQSLGLESTNMSYSVTAGAVIEKPPDRDVICHASAWDFNNGRDFRIKMCTEVDFNDFITIHHEMGHIQYFMLYKKQPLILRTGANPGFHEAVGDTIALSVATPKHLNKIGLISTPLDPWADLNALMDMALERVAFLPFALLVDKWRWDVFSKKVTREQWNAHWWHYRKTIQKVKPPISRSDVFDFDPGSKFHVPADTQYISYFVAHVLEFQFHKALCVAAGQYNANDKSLPLHKCDIYGSKEAGRRLRAGLSLGASRHWRVALREITGETELSGAPILEYFKPLYEFLKLENRKMLS